MKKIVLVFIAALMFSNTSPLLAQDYQKGLTAYNAGDYATALKEWEPLAEQGHASAQNNLGLMYANGQGVPQDYQIAYMWANLAGANGAANALKIRDIVAKEMSRTDISKAQDMSRACIENNYKNCP